MDQVTLSLLSGLVGAVAGAMIGVGGAIVGGIIGGWLQVNPVAEVNASHRQSP